MNSNDQSEYVIRRFDENNISDLEQLYSGVYKKKSPPHISQKNMILHIPGFHILVI